MSRGVQSKILCTLTDTHKAVQDGNRDKSEWWAIAIEDVHEREVGPSLSGTQGVRARGGGERAEETPGEEQEKRGERECDGEDRDGGDGEREGARED
jgi:hypothetical protein